MKKRPGPVVSARKHPSQARSTRLVADILEAAVRVLIREGARRFTTARVAEEAGVSVGSFYQYFPNKEAILFRLQSDEWRQTGELIAGMLGDTDRPPLERLRAAVRAFFRSEYEEAALRVALGDVAPLYRDAPEASRHREAARQLALAFVDEVLPHAPKAKRAFAAEVLMTTITTVGEGVSGRARSKAEMDAWADEMGEMLCAYLERLAA
ncbi:TetR family transcriptional regulator [Burkholderia sp. WAC0059]|uniref:TetR family transcriptional regulator n=1 Tax=Burkholderia sp. WAC0059 TaxID=2066022 RepID=UPI000C7F2D82|nr:TetR family transcriptional regulator [Burkholderia sp. WAC0059]PLZ03094.1 TetR family transcriptional regulator [Burkholderia sp. WAC0059]